MITYTGGTFDSLHAGHLELLAACRDMAGQDGRVVVALNRDEFIVRYKRRAPLFPYAARAEMLRACRFVDLVVCNSGDEDSGIAIDVVRPDVIVIGADWWDEKEVDPEARYLKQLGVTRAWMAERNLHVEYVARTRGVSSTGIRPQMVDYYRREDAGRVE